MLLVWNRSGSVNKTSNAVSKSSQIKQNISGNTVATTFPLASRISFSVPVYQRSILVFPLIYHQISEEIPEASRSLITRLFQLWLALLVTLLLNVIACISILTAHLNNGGSDVGSSIGCLRSRLFSTCVLNIF
jgi:hypothetical protein